MYLADSIIFDYFWLLLSILIAFEYLQLYLIYLSFTPYNRYIRSALFRYQKTEKIPVRAASVDGAF